MLTETQLKALKPRATLYRKADAHGLCIEVSPSGSKLWRYRYRYGARAKMMALGRWPEVSLSNARESHRKARAILAAGGDPMADKRERRDAVAREELSKFPVVAAAWLAKKKLSVRAETYRKAEYVVNQDLIPALRKHSINTLTTKDAATVIERISSRAPNLAAKARQYLGGIVTYAIQNGLRDDGKVLSLRGTVSHKSKGHIPAVTKPSELKKVLLAIDSYGSATTRAALKLASLTALRPSVVASAQWEHLDLEAAEWHIPATLMKTGFDHIVPLPKQAIELLKELAPGGHKSKYVFPSPAKQKTPHLGRDALSKALRELGFQGQHSTHGFRGALRTIGRERLGLSVDLLEAQLAHAKKGEVNKAYDRTTFNDERRLAMQQWANYLDELRQHS